MSKVTTKKKSLQTLLGRIFFCCSLLFFSLINAEESSHELENLTKKIETMENHCKSELGIGILELGLLMQAKRGSVFSENGLRSEGRLLAAERLSTSGYVQIFRSQGNGKTWIELIPTLKGQAIIDTVIKSTK